jgi:hypothetical protein
LRRRNPINATKANDVREVTAAFAEDVRSDACDIKD